MKDYASSTVYYGKSRKPVLSSVFTQCCKVITILKLFINKKGNYRKVLGDRGQIEN